jgi:hypothetical protein
VLILARVSTTHALIAIVALTAFSTVLAVLYDDTRQKTYVTTLIT